MGRIRRSTQQSGQQMATSMQRFRGAIDSSVRSLFSLRTAAVAVAGATGLFLLSTRAIRTADEIGKMSRQVGVSAEALQELRFAAGQSGIETGELDTAMEQLNRRLGEAAEGSGTARDALAELGIAMEEIEGLGTDRVLEIIAERVQRLEDPMRRAALMNDLFGRSGQRMARLLMEGADGIRTMRERAQALGIVLDNETIAKAEQAQNELSEMGSVFQTIALRIGLELMPHLRELAQTMTSPEFIDGTKRFADEIARAMRWVGEHGDTLLRIFLAAKGASLGARIGGMPGAVVGGALGGLSPEIVRTLTASARVEVDGLEGEIERAQRALAEFEQQIAGIQSRLESGQLSAQQRRQSEQALEDLQAGAVEKMRELNELEARRAEILAEATQEVERAAPATRDYAVAVGEADDAVAATIDTTRTATENLRRQNEQIEELLGIYRNAPATIDAVRQAQELDNAARAQNIDLSTAQGQAWAEEFRRAQQLASALDTVVELHREASTPYREHQARIAELTRLYRAGHITIDQYSQAVQLADQRMAEATRTSDDMIRVLEDLGDEIDRMPALTRNMEWAFEGAMRNMILHGNSLRDVMRNLANDIINVAIQAAVIQPIGAAIGGAVSGFFGGLFGFRTGGQFEVGGSGGADSQVVAFKATPGEVVTVQTPHQQASVSPSMTVAVTPVVNVYAPPGSQARTQASGDGRTIDVLIDEAVASNLRPGTRTWRSLRTAFADVNPSLARR